MLDAKGPLDQTEVVRYLLEKKLIDPIEICDSVILTSDVSRRNSNVKVVRQQGASYLVKQCVEGNAIETLANEAKVYDLFHGDCRYRDLSLYIPRTCGYDPKMNILVIELVGSNAQDLDHYHLRGYFSKTIARLAARALAELHKAFIPDFNGRSALAAPKYSLPWVFSLRRPSIGQVRDLSAASSQVVGIIQRYHEFDDMIDQCGGYWEPTSLIHGDIKWANFIVYSPSGAGRKTRLKIIDWEYAGIGDPCWDLGGVFSAYLSSWILSMALTSSGHHKEEGFCRFPLVSMQPAIHSFWKEYISCMKLDNDQREKYLWRATLFSAVRLVQTAIEHTQRTTVVSRNIVQLMQLAMNTLIYPVETIVHVLGINLATD